MSYPPIYRVCLGCFTVWERDEEDDADCCHCGDSLNERTFTLRYYAKEFVTAMLEVACRNYKDRQNR